jgi:hypothetical protein
MKDMTSNTGAQNIASARYKCGSWQFGSYSEHTPEKIGNINAKKINVVTNKKINITPLDGRIQLNMSVPFISLGYHLTYIALAGYPSGKCLSPGFIYICPR